MGLTLTNQHSEILFSTELPTALPTSHCLKYCRQLSSWLVSGPPLLHPHFISTKASLTRASTEVLAEAHHIHMQQHTHKHTLLAGELSGLNKWTV